VIVTNQDQPFVLPRAAKFATKRDFYEFYQDYYHCPNPDAGDVQILQPAFVSRSGNGWTLVATGLLEVIKEQPKKKPVAPVIQAAPPPAPVPKREEPEPEPEPVITAKKEAPHVRTCSECGSEIEEKYAFCWKCGHSMTNERKPRQIFSSALDLDDELTIQNEPRPFNSTVLPWTTSRAPEHPSSSRGSVLKLLAIGGVAFVLLSLGAFGLFRSETQTVSATSATSTAPVAQPAQPQPSVSVTTEISRNAPAETTTTQQIVPNPEDELKKLRERRISASASDRPKIIQAFAKVEKQYPRDYRFPYERAKFAVKGSQASSRSEAFKALTVAAQKAITTGKANEMLNGLESDKSGDFSRLSQGRFEWSRLVAALKRKDTSLLGE
jgi:hypothetical protein